MNYLKMLGLVAVAATALTAFAGTASAAVTTGLPVAEIEATSTNFGADGTVNITCAHSHFKLTMVENTANHPHKAGSTFATVTTWVWVSCSRTMTTTATGTMSIASDGTVRSIGARFTVQTTILGFPVHCIYKTENTVVGKLTEGVAPAKMHIGSAPIPQEATSGLCGEDAEWTGTYTVTSPTTAIFVD
ncbi:MAG TPA: hypothetical protein VLI94_08860 [Solirubrobacterales bacterium]|nr:hypothetical protein [Solirubrobacterales bacterium]